MNREIKFRGWDKEQSKILTHEEIDELDKGGIAHWMDIIKPNNRDGIDVMQYTGLKDRNGKEIYESDCDDNGNTVEFTNGCWTLNGDRPLSIMLSVFEVKGNIYENSK